MSPDKSWQEAAEKKQREKAEEAQRKRKKAAEAAERGRGPQIALPEEEPVQKEKKEVEFCDYCHSPLIKGFCPNPNCPAKQKMDMDKDKLKEVGKEGTKEGIEEAEKEGAEAIGGKGVQKTGEKLAQKGGETVVKEGAKAGAKAGAGAAAKTAAGTALGGPIGTAIGALLSLKDIKDIKDAFGKKEKKDKSFENLLYWFVLIVGGLFLSFGFFIILAMIAISLLGIAGRTQAIIAMTMEPYNDLKKISNNAHLNLNGTSTKEIIQSSNQDFTKDINDIKDKIKLDLGVGLITTQQSAKINEFINNSIKTNNKLVDLTKELNELLQMSQEERDRKLIKKLKEEISAQKKLLKESLKQAYEESYKCELPFVSLDQPNSAGRIKLPENKNFIEYIGDEKLKWGKPRTICTLLKLQLDLQEKISIGDISPETGKTAKYDLHQDGKDVIFKVPGTSIMDENYDQNKAGKLIEKMLKLNIYPIFTGDQELAEAFNFYQINGEPKVRYDKKFSDYYLIHIEF